MDVKAAGKTWAIPDDISVDALLKFRDWCAEQYGDPYADLEDAIRFKRPEEEQRALYERGKAVKEQLRYFSLKTEIGQHYLNTEAGSLKFSELKLRDSFPEITDRELSALIVAYAEQAEARKKAEPGPEGNAQAPSPALAATA